MTMRRVGFHSVAGCDRTIARKLLVMVVVVMMMMMRMPMPSFGRVNCPKNHHHNDNEYRAEQHQIVLQRLSNGMNCLERIHRFGRNG